MKYLQLLLALLFSACATPTPAQEAIAVKTAIDAGRAGCLVAHAKSVQLTEAQVEWCRIK